MALSRKRLRILLVLGVVIGLAVGVNASMLTQDSGEYSGQGIIGSSDRGPHIGLPPDGSAVNLESTPENDHELVIETDAGNATFTSYGYTKAIIKELGADWTRMEEMDVSSNTLIINPEEGESARISGAATAFEFHHSPSVDDGNTDFVINGFGDSTVTLQSVSGVSDGGQVGAIDGNGELLAISTVESGQVTFDSISTSGSHDLQLVTTDILISDASPTGDLNSTPSELSVTIEDDGENDYTGEMDFTLDGSHLDTVNITGAGTYTTSLPSSGQTGGEHDWGVDLTGSPDVRASYSYRVPDQIFVRNESNPSELIDDPTEITVRFYGSNQVFERSTTNGTIDMEGLPVNEDFHVQVDASGNYTSRNVYIDSIYDQQNVYLLNENVSSVESRFILTDPTGQFPGQTVLYISKAIGTNGDVEYQTVYADEFGVEGVTPTLEEGERYRLRIEAPDGTTQDMGDYRATTSETVELRPSGPAVEFDPYDEDANWGVGADINNESIFARYEDPENLTDSVTVSIYERNNESNVLEPAETYYDLGSLNSQYNLTENESEKQWVVNFEIDRDGETLEKQVIVSQRGNIVPSSLDGGWVNVVGIGLLLLSGGAFSLLNRGVGAVIIGLEGGLLWWTGWLSGATVGAAVVIYLFIAIAYSLHTSRV